MTTNPFEEPNGSYQVLINDENQYSLWPSLIEIPTGWAIVHSDDSRSACIDFIEQQWTDMRPQSLIDTEGE